jgi:hypothetical protein
MPFSLTERHYHASGLFYVISSALAAAEWWGFDMA